MYPNWRLHSGPAHGLASLAVGGVPSEDEDLNYPLLSMGPHSPAGAEHEAVIVAADSSGSAGETHAGMPNYNSGPASQCAGN
jgi:hypothetical protein